MPFGHNFFVTIISHLIFSGLNIIKTHLLPHGTYVHTRPSANPILTMGSVMGGLFYYYGPHYEGGHLWIGHS